MRSALLLAAIFSAAIAGAAESSVRLLNHQDFPIHLPVTLHDAASITSGSLVQRDGTDAIFVVNVAANAEQSLSLSANSVRPRNLISAAPAEDGIVLTVDGKPAGTLAWDLVMEPARKVAANAEVVSSKSDYAQKFSALPLAFTQTTSGTIFDVWSATAAKTGLALAFELRVFHEGFVDARVRLTTESAATATDVSAALVCRWTHPPLVEQTLCYDNRRGGFAVDASTAFHQVEGRHWHIQHGVDWLRARLQDGPSVAWINPFDPVFTVQTAKTPASYTVGSQAQFGREAQSTPAALFAVTEIARGTLRSYRDRVVEHVLPPRGESFTITTRLAFSADAMTDDAADQLFLGTTAFREQRAVAGGTELHFGVPGVRFGTSYFPYSTFGENFDADKLPGMDREGFWPLAADTVRQWPLFADQIRQDLRLVKWMGFSLVRLHHLELLGPIEPDTRRAYLDFLFGELRHLRLKALLDVYASPAQIEELLRRYGDAVDAVEIENETLIWGIPLDRVDEWKQIRAAVQRAAPHAAVHWTAQNNTGVFDRLARLGVGFDRVGLHSYVDTLDALPSARGWALAAGDYGTRIGKPPTVTEWNYRGLTRMSPAARAKIYPQIFEGALATHSLAEFYQFQFQETLAPNPVVGRGNLLRHYELFNLSRHPKIEALEFATIIERYSAGDDPTKQLAVAYAETELNTAGERTTAIALTNRSTHSLTLTARIEAPAGLLMEIAGDEKISLAPGETKSLAVTLATTDRRPGFYHGAVRLEGPGGFLRYAAVEARLPGQPALKPADEATADFLTHVSAVVYGQDAPVIEVETAIAIAQTLESATGRLIPYYQLDDLPADARAAGKLIVVGTAKTNALAKETAKNLLVITGATPEAAKTAGMDFILRYWPAAKDSAAGKVGLVRKTLPRGIDPAKLP